MSADRHEGLSDAAVLVAIGCVASVAAVLWLWGGVAGALFGAGWPHVGLGQLLGIAVRLPRGPRPGRLPGRPQPGGLPGAGGFYAALAVLAGAGGFAGLIAGRASAGLARRPRAPAGRVAASCGGSAAPAERAPGPPGARPSRHAPASRRAAPRAGRVRPAAVGQVGRTRGPGAARVGRAGGRLLDQDRPAGGDARAARALGEVFVFDPFGLAPETEAHTWSPLHGARTWDGALEVAWRLASAAELDQRGVEGGDFWAIAAEQRLAPLLYAAAASGAGMDAVVRWAYGQGARELHEALAQLSGEAGDDQRASTRTPPTTRSGRSRPRPTGPAPRSRRPPRRSCARTASRASLRSAQARARSPPTGCSTRARRCT